MCYNVAYIEKRSERVAKHYGAAFKPEDRTPEFFTVSGFSHPELFVVTAGEPSLIQCYQWGLIPAWCKDEQQALEMRDHTLNAKAETVFEKPSFRNSITTKRCLVIVSGFYEWHTLNKKKYPFFIGLRDHDFFSLGGLYEHWANPDTGELHHTFSVITVDANPLMARIHNSKKRMPLIIPEHLEKEWLNTNLPKPDVQQLMLPFDDAGMKAYSISRRITDRHLNPNVPEVMAPFEYPELKSLF